MATKNRIKLKGKLVTYLKVLAYLGIMLLLVNLAIFTVDFSSGLILLVFTGFYFVAVMYLNFYNKPIIMNELISFATQYGQIQKRLLKDLDLAHAILDDSGRVMKMIRRVCRQKRWRMPGLERFIYDFLEQIIYRDQTLMEKYELELDKIEDAILKDVEDVDLNRISDIRSDIRDLRIHYEQLTDLGQELEENENDFFKEDNLRYFRLFLNRMDRLRDEARSLHEYTMQVRDLQHTQLDIKQNRIMTLLTVVTTIFMPLTLIVGWYGMNFKFMPELEWHWSYPVVFIVSVLIVVLSLIYFKKKKWL